MLSAFGVGIDIDIDIGIGIGIGIGVWGPSQLRRKGSPPNFDGAFVWVPLLDDKNLQLNHATVAMLAQVRREYH